MRKQASLKLLRHIRSSKSSTEPIPFDLIPAITAFETLLVSRNSRYDLHAHRFYGALTGREFEGIDVFRSFVDRCAERHSPTLFSNL